MTGSPQLVLRPDEEVGILAGFQQTRDDIVVPILRRHASGGPFSDDRLAHLDGAAIDIAALDIGLGQFQLQIIALFAQVARLGQVRDRQGILLLVIGDDAAPKRKIGDQRGFGLGIVDQRFERGDQHAFARLINRRVAGGLGLKPA